jgi:hypothetical protein
MDRYDEGKHVHSTGAEDEVRSTPASDDVRVVRVNDDFDSMRSEERIEGARDERDMDTSKMRDESRPVAVPEDTDEAPKRAGDILGLGGAPVPKTTADQTIEQDAESVAHRPARTITDEPTGGSDMPRSKGATGIDMGSGGSGTDLE